MTCTAICLEELLFNIVVALVWTISLGVRHENCKEMKRVDAKAISILQLTTFPVSAVGMFTQTVTLNFRVESGCV